MKAKDKAKLLEQDGLFNDTTWYKGRYKFIVWTLLTGDGYYHSVTYIASQMCITNRHVYGLLNKELKRRKLK